MSAKHEINVGFKFPEKKGGGGQRGEMACSSCVSLRPFPSTLLKKQGGYTVKSKEGEGSAAFGSRDEGDCASHVLSSRRHSSIGMCVSVVSCWVGVGSTPEANSGDPIPIRHARKHRTLSFPASMKKKNESLQDS